MNYSKGRKIYITISAMAVVAVLITIFCLSAQNGEDSSATSGFFTEFVTVLAGRPVKESIVRTLAHFCEFAGLGFLVANLFFAIKNTPKPIFSIIFSAGYAITDEIHQIFVPGRACQLTDLTVDLCGIVLGTITFCCMYALLKFFKTNQKLIKHNPFSAIIVIPLIFSVSINSFAFLWGDLNEDSQISVEDARKALRISAGIEQFDTNDLKIRAIDTDGSQTITISEVIQVLKIASNIATRYELSNKIIVNFGDSIFGNHRDTSEQDKSISKMISEQTDSICYNAGFGGCRMATHSNYWDAFSMHSLADSIATNDWTRQENALIDGTNKLPYYFSETLTLLKTINWNQVDYITIGYGTNDYWGNVFLNGTEHSFVNEWDSFKGALKYSIKTIQNAYPNIQIVIITPMWRFFINDGNYSHSSDDPESANTRGYYLPEYVAACFKIANEFQIPCIDTYHALGINQSNYLYYFNSFDGTHPNTNGRQLRANIISNYLIEFEKNKQNE